MIQRRGGPKPKYNCNENFFTEETEAAFYVAGFIAADGCVLYPKRGRKILTITLSKKDADHLNKIKTLMSATNPLHFYINGKYESVRLTISSNKICEDLLNKYNIMPNKTFKYSLPKELKNHPLINHFIRGYIDGDGSWMNKYKRNTTHRPQIRVNLLGTDQFLIQVRNILYKECKTNKLQTISKINNIYELNYDGNNQTNIIKNYLYSNSTIYLDRKYQIAQLSSAKPKGRKLTINNVQEIRQDIIIGKSISYIAKKFGISKSSICDIKSGRTWSEWI